MVDTTLWSVSIPTNNQTISFAEKVINYNESLYSWYSNTNELENVEFRNALLTYGTPDLILKVICSIGVFETYPDIANDFINRRMFLNLTSDSDICISDLICEAGYNGGTAEDNMNKLMFAMLDHGYDPNIVFSDGRDIFEFALESGNYALIDKLINMPNYQLNATHLQRLNTRATPLDVARESMIARLRPTSSASRKRTRYDLD